MAFSRARYVEQPVLGRGRVGGVLIVARRVSSVGVGMIQGLLA